MGGIMNEMHYKNQRKVTRQSRHVELPQLQP